MLHQTCTLCGQRVSMPDAAKVRFAILAASGEPNVRVVYADGIEVHRCAAETT